METPVNIRIFNTLTREKQVFKPVHTGKVLMYTCGPTVYSNIHIGNARPLIFFDVVRRYFHYRGYDITYVQNITDIDDKIIARASEENTTTGEIAARYLGKFNSDRENLGVHPPDLHPKATEYVDEMIALIRSLIEKGCAYERGGNVFFDVTKDPLYGSLSGKDREMMTVGERVDDEIQQLKKNTSDFSLWKPAKEGEPFWESPWGKGRPGWHTECVVMAAKLLQVPFDIHAGGVDLVFPHHENEAAQARGNGNRVFANYWMHNELVTMKNKKMAKSEGNIILVEDLLTKFSTEAVRLLFLQTHYRKPISFDDRLVQNAEAAVNRIDRVLQNAETFIGSNIDASFKDDHAQTESPSVRECRERVEAAMDDDFNTPQAVAALFTLIDSMNAALQVQPESSESKMMTIWGGRNLLNNMNGVFGIIRPVVRDVDRRSIEGMIDDREIARSQHDWQTADRIRDELLRKGIVLEDKKSGTRWWRKKV